MEGNDVKELQKYLNTHNYPVSLTGAGSLNNETTYFGLKTKQAVTLFQKANGLLADGMVGKMTRERMR
jgi:peptidoglycan hydrolase-like protein with peptidoglycan-binding domain